MGCMLIVSDIWKEKSSPFLQGTALAEVTSSIVAPLVIHPFLSEKTNNEEAQLLLFNNTLIYDNHTDCETVEVTNVPSAIWIPYTVLGIAMNIAAFIAISVYCCFSPKESKESEQAHETDIEYKEKNVNFEAKEKSEKCETNLKCSKKYDVGVICCCCAMGILIATKYICFFQYWVIFVTNCELSMSKSTGVLMLSAFSISMLAGNVFNILLAFKIKPIKLLLISTLSILFGNIVILIYANTSEMMVWIGGLMVDVWQEKSNPLIQTLDFVDLMAGFISPIIVQPFLSQSTTENTGLQLINTTENVSTVEALASEEKQESNIWLPLGTFGILMNVIAFVALIMYFLTHKSSKIVERENENGEQVEKKEEKQDVNSERMNYKEKRYAIIVTAVFCFIVLIYNVEIISFFQFWTTFVMNSEMKISKSTAVFMLSAFPLAMASSSVAAILLSMKVKSLKIIMGLLMFRIIGNITVVLNSVTFLWIGGILMSIGFGPFNATIFNCLKERVKMTNIVGSIATFCQFFATAAAVTSLIGYFMQNSPLVLIYCNFGVIMMIIVSFAVVSMLDRWKLQNSDMNTKI
ncbi:sodium-dependent glucose transporter 1-like protein [Leptotrombidium deliense]|uniref:Major facilitator superfamily domain-containing protein 4A n=1 Tax=Leptotrombidium deliense TaxID=299467 RepID=A0A443SCH7_9ACAR|nr:sodium-dependent glucose transporter 1-like protein [Leptotrombidium deliense]